LSQSRNPFDEADETAAVDLLADLQREAARDDLPPNLQKLARRGVEYVSELLEAVRAGNTLAVEELVLGTLEEDGTRRLDGIRQELPLWARGKAVLDALIGVVVVDESKSPRR
jgi:hypothetical protein